MIRVLYSMFYDMRRQAHWALVAPDRSMAAIGGPGKPLWIWLRNDRKGLRPFFYAWREKYPTPLTGLVARADAACICAADYAAASGCTYQQRQLAAYYLPAGTPIQEPLDGWLRAAGANDGRLLSQWISAFYAEALKADPPFDEQCLSEKSSRKRPAGHAPVTGPLFLWQPGHQTEPAAMGMLCGPSGGTGRLNMIYTPPHLRGRGYGRNTVSALAAMARREGKLPVLYTAVDNVAANGLYRSLGFREAGRLTEVIFRREIDK